MMKSVLKFVIATQSAVALSLKAALNKPLKTVDLANVPEPPSGNYAPGSFFFCCAAPEDDDGNFKKYKTPISKTAIAQVGETQYDLFQRFIDTMNDYNSALVAAGHSPTKIDAAVTWPGFTYEALLKTLVHSKREWIFPKATPWMLAQVTVIFDKLSARLSIVKQIVVGHKNLKFSDFTKLHHT